ncbi:MAG: hypothetical protein QG553_658 [Patescibacteria group bacterium]|nr:hypothetical protein [Patescibacteria group bacterium]
MGINEERLAESFTWTPLAIEVGLELVGNIEPPMSDLEALAVGGMLRGDKVEHISQDPLQIQQIELRYEIVTARDRKRNGFDYNERMFGLSSLVAALRESEDVVAKQVAMLDQDTSSTAAV